METESGRRLKVAILFGGRSAEHEVSILSAKSVISALDRSKYDPILIGIDREGQWFLNEGSLPLLEGEGQRGDVRDGNRTPVSFLSGGQPGSPLRLSDGGTRRVDVIFPLLHGPDGEDGAIQGLARLVDLPCVSAGILGSAVGMDKDVSKRLLRDAGLSVAPFEVLFGDGVDTEHLRRIEERLDYPLFVKPANLGSSVGVSKATQRDELKAALRLAFQFEEKVLVEQAIVGREMECSILGNRDPMVSLPGEVVVDEGFYTYERKYIDENGATLLIPAEIDDTATKRLQQTALTTFTTLEGRGMARVDMFLLPSGEVFVNEVNTIPGFTKNSMYPKLWEASGVSYTELLDRLIALAVEEFQRWRSRRVTR